MTNNKLMTNNHRPTIGTKLYRLVLLPSITYYFLISIIDKIPNG